MYRASRTGKFRHRFHLSPSAGRLHREVARGRSLPGRTCAVWLAVSLLLMASAGGALAQNKCAGSKIKAAGKKAKCLLGLAAKQAATGVSPDPEKVQKCKDKFALAFAKAEARGVCTTTGDADAIESKVDAFVADVGGELPGTTTTTTIIGSTTTTTAPPTTACSGYGTTACQDCLSAVNEGCAQLCFLSGQCCNEVDCIVCVQSSVCDHGVACATECGCLCP
jgi:hypothetical protein